MRFESSFVFDCSKLRNNIASIHRIFPIIIINNTFTSYLILRIREIRAEDISLRGRRTLIDLFLRHPLL